MTGRDTSHRALIAAAVLGPALLVGTMAWWSWDRVNREINVEISRTVDILFEHTAKTVEADRVMLARIDDQVAALDWPEIIRREPELHRFLARLPAESEEIEAAFIADSDGKVQVLSREAPDATAVNISDRPYFAMARQSQGVIIDGPFRDRVSDHRVFNIVRRLSSADGAFRGIAVLSISPRYLAEFWQGVVSPGDTVSLVRDDGVVLARFPEAPLGDDEKPPRFSAETVAKLRVSDSGLIDTVSAIDGVARIDGYRRLKDQPIHIVYAVDRRNVAREWYPSLVALAGLGIAAITALLLTAFSVIRRARGEALALARAERTAAALRASEARQRELYRNAPAPMHSLDAEHRIVDVNDEWLKLLGFERDEVIGRSVTDFYLPGSLPSYDEPWRNLLEAGSIRDADRTYVKKSGDVIEVLLSAVVERDDSGNLLRVISAVTDVTARRRAERAARRERQFSELLVESGTEGIVGIDREYRYTVWNPYIEAISGIGREEALGRTVFEMFPHTKGTAIEEGWRDALAGRRSAVRSWPYSYPRSGRSGFIDQEFAPLLGSDQSIIGAISFVRDITERLRIEEALRQSQKMESIGQLTGGVAHDFNNLLTVIIGNLESLERRVDDKDASFARLIGAAMRGATRGATLTQRLLAFSRRQPLRPEPVNLNKLVAGISDLLRRTLGERIAIETVLAGGLWGVSADANQLESALLNLAVNARDAMPDGGKLTIESANTYLDETYAATHEEVKPGQYVMLAVSDTGTGMSEEVIKQAFEPFFTTKGVGQGTGLGLSQVYGFVKQSGGHVKIYSETGEGTTVRLYFPRLTTGEAEEESETEAEAIAGGTREDAILVVEDDEDVRNYSAGALRELGYRVIEAADAVEALRLLRNESDIRLMFTDVGLPNGVNGRQLANDARERYPDLKVLFTTGYARNAIVHHGRLDPGVAFIAKPFTYAELAAKIQLVLETGMS